MRPTALLAQARAAGIRVRLDGEMGLRLAYKADAEPALLAAIRTHKRTIIDYLRDDHMPCGAGVCIHCDRVAWLPAGPVSAPCEECEIDRLLRSGQRAVAPRLAEDEAEVWLRQEIEP